MNQMTKLVFFPAFIFILLFALAFWCVCRQHKTSSGKRKIYVRPIWGLGNRIRTLRHCFELGKKTARDVILVDNQDCAGFQGSLKDTLKLTSPSVHASAAFDYDKKIYPDDGKCELFLTSEQIKEIAEFNGDVYIDGVCHIQSNENLDTCKMWKMHPFHMNQNDLVGVHIRQGSLADYEYKNFFGEWQTKESRLPGPPYYCCFKDKSKNTSSCPSNIQPLDDFVDAMKSYGPKQKFCVVTDRPGCSIEIHRLFPGQIQDMHVFISQNTDAQTAANDWLSLATCKEIIVSNISSFSYEASRVHDAKIIRLPKNEPPKHAFGQVLTQPEWCIVCTHYKEDTSWMKGMLKLGVRIVVYDCGVQRIPLEHSLLEIRDKTGTRQKLDGFYSYYHFCYTDYHNLPKHMLFLHGHDDHWHQSKTIMQLYKESKRIVENDSSVHYINLSTVFFGDWIGLRHGEITKIGQAKILDALKEPKPEKVHEICCGQAYIHRSRIQKRTHANWKEILQVSENIDWHTTEGWALELSFHRVMGEEWQRPIISEALKQRALNANFDLWGISEVDIRLSKIQDKLFITYGNSKFIKSRKRIENEAKATNMFTKVHVYTEKDICNKLIDKSKYPETYKVFNEMTRLGGYEMWKPFIIHDTMSRAKEGDIVVYADAGCTVHNNPGEIQKTFDAINKSEKGVSHCNNTGGFRGQRRYLNRMDTMRQFLREDEVEPFLQHNNGMEYEANRFIFRKCDFSMQFVNAFREAAIQYPWLWTDNPSSIPNLPEFVDHRHGQSIYQLLAFRHGILGGDCNFDTWLTADRIRE